MSGRARVPLGATERAEIFGNPTSGRTAPSSEADFLSNKDVPRAVSRQQQQAGAGSASATPYGALSPGRRRCAIFVDIDRHESTFGAVVADLRYSSTHTIDMRRRLGCGKPKLLPHTKVCAYPAVCNFAGVQRYTQSMRIHVP